MLRGRRNGPPLRGIACAILVIGCAILPLPADTDPQKTEGMLGNAYPLEVSVSFHKALLHWMDSLAMLTGHGSTGGKTIPAHRLQYEKTHGTPTPKDVTMLTRYHTVRLGDITGTETTERDRLTLAFFETSSLDEALERSAEILVPNRAKALAGALRHFAPRYEKIWNEGKIPNGFLERARNSERRTEMAELLAGIARFFDVSAEDDPRPEIILVPVPHGFGTHAQAIGSFLLIEVRRGEELTDEAAPIIHENVHFLYRKIPESRRELLEQAALDSGGDEAWLLLREALPTAIAQGVADRSFRPETWSRSQSWYHDSAVDEYAKRIFELIENVLESGGKLDEAFVKKLVSAYEPSTEQPVTPR